jgi:hypothetical protein
MVHLKTNAPSVNDGPWAWPEEGWLTGSSNGVHQASEGRDALGVRIEVLAIFLFRNFSQCFPLDDFALRTILKTALNIAMHRSRDVFERSKRAFF